MIHHLRTICLISVLLAALLFWGGCAEQESSRVQALDGTSSVPSETTESVATEVIEGTETLEEADFEMVAMGPELTRAEERGLMIFRHYCAHCHGQYGFGDGPNSFGLETAPRDLQEVEMDSRSDEEIRLVITEGGAARGHSRLMPPWGQTLEPNRIDDLVALIRVMPDLEIEEEESGVPPLDDGEDDMGDFSL